MSKLSFYVVICGCALSAMSAPQHEHSKQMTIEVSEALNRSVCPIQQVIDEDPGRIPRRIRMLKCSQTPNPLCQKQNMAHACCNRQYNFNARCAELIEHVLVSYRSGPTFVAIPVSVGCTCNIIQS